MFFYPKVVLQKEKTEHDNYPWLAPVLISKTLKPFCCFVAVEGNEEIHMGGGTITPEGIFTAAHLFNFGFENIVITYFVDECHHASIVINDVKLNSQNDVALLNIKIPRKSLPLPISGAPKDTIITKFLSFGCPGGIFGIVWKPNIINVVNKYYISQGLIIPGVSGGGLFGLDKKNRVWLLGINVHGYLDSKTLYSVKI